MLIFLTTGLPAGEGSVWFLDRSLQWHFLADTFLEYFRLLIVHLGLPQWQYLFTDIGLSQQAMVRVRMNFLWHFRRAGDLIN